MNSVKTTNVKESDAEIYNVCSQYRKYKMGAGDMPVVTPELKGQIVNHVRETLADSKYCERNDIHMDRIALLAELAGLNREKKLAAKIAYKGWMDSAKSMGRDGLRNWRETFAIMSAREIGKEYLFLAQRDPVELIEGRREEKRISREKKAQEEAHRQILALDSANLEKRVKEYGNGQGDWFTDNLQAEAIRCLGDYIKANPAGQEELVEKAVSTIKEIAELPSTGFCDDNYNYNMPKEAAGWVLRDLGK